jgi:hypothetical protein
MNSNFKLHPKSLTIQAICKQQHKREEKTIALYKQNHSSQKPQRSRESYLLHEIDATQNPIPNYIKEI